jgi:hypothetical protein
LVLGPLRNAGKEMTEVNKRAVEERLENAREYRCPAIE